MIIGKKFLIADVQCALLYSLSRSILKLVAILLNACIGSVYWSFILLFRPYQYDYMFLGFSGSEFSRI